MAIDNVSGGELIDPLWGNSVADTINAFLDGEDVADFGFTALGTPSSGYALPSSAYLQGFYLFQVGRFVHIMGAVDRSGGAVGSGAPTLVYSSVSPAPPRNCFGLAINQTSGLVSYCDLRSDAGLRLYGPMATNDRIHVTLSYPVSEP